MEMSLSTVRKGWNAAVQAPSEHGVPERDIGYDFRMNYFAHAYRYLHDPYFAAGTAVPDWLSVVNRGVRLRPRVVAPHLENGDGVRRRVAAGILQHLTDDRRFHGTPAFSEALTTVLSVIRPTMVEGRIPTVFLSHLLVEVLLDAALAARLPNEIDAYYRALEGVSAEAIAASVSRMTGQPIPGFAPFIRLFCRERILFDYLEDDKLWMRLGQVMRRLRLPPLPDELFDTLPRLRALIAARQEGLLAPCRPEAAESAESSGDRADRDDSAESVVPA
ncbi:hypothetical protein JCM17478_27440 [Thermopirellula anaerolimosa]